MRYGILIDYFCMQIFKYINQSKNIMRTLIAPVLFTLLLLTISCGNTKTSPDAAVAQVTTETTINTDNDKPVQMNKSMFIANVSDFERNPDSWAYKGSRPCVIDFYADWCRPCKMVAPLMESFASTYKGKVDIYKVNVDQERELAELFGIRSIPTVLFCPMDGKPQMSQGALSKEDYEKVINEFLLKQATESTAN
jgi:thioredoxin